MSTLTATPKGAATRDTIVDRAYDIARASGVEGLSIGPLAAAVGMSKSGVFAHFGSREDLQLAVLEAAADALRQCRADPGAVAAARPAAPARDHAELVRVGAQHDARRLRADRLGHGVRRPPRRPARPGACTTNNAGAANSRAPCSSRSTAGHLRAGDVEQYVFELYAIPLTVHHEAGLFGYDVARRHGDAAVERWIAASSPKLSPRR